MGALRWPAPRDDRRHPDQQCTCRQCGLVVIERWHGTGRHDFTSEPPFGGCLNHPTHPGRGPHDFECKEYPDERRIWLRQAREVGLR